MIGTKIGAIMAQLAEALPINKLINDDTKMNSKINGMPDRLMLFKNSAPYTPITMPMFDSSKKATQCQAVKARTINVPIEAIVSDIWLATSLSLRIDLLTIP